MNSNYPFEPLAEGTRNKRKVHCRGCNKPLAPGEAEFVYGYRCPECAGKTRRKNAAYDRDWADGMRIVMMVRQDDPQNAYHVEWEFQEKIGIYPDGLIGKALKLCQLIKATWPGYQLDVTTVYDIISFLRGYKPHLEIDVPLARVVLE